LTFGIAAVLAALGLGASVLAPRTEEFPMRTELSPEAMRAPLRSVTITFGAGQHARLLAGLRGLADRLGFAIRLSGDPARPGATFVQLYRTDIKMIGWVPADVPRLDLTIYRTLHRVPPAAVEQGAAALRQLAAEVPSGRFEQTIFHHCDDMDFEPRTGIAPARVARVAHVDGAQEAIRRQIALFADENGYAVRFAQTTPDPKDLKISLYSEGLDIFITEYFSHEKMSVTIKRSGDRTASDALIDHTFEALRRAIEQVPGSSFTRQR
jgi:hypothetical protein